MFQAKSKYAIINKTQYQTRDLRKLFVKVAKEEGVNFASITVKYKNPKLQKRQMYTKDLNILNQHLIHGRALYNNYYLTMFLPEYRFGCSENGSIFKDRINELNEYEVNQLAQVFVHELGHNLSLHHKDMLGWRTFNVDYVRGFRVRQKEIKMVDKPKINLREKRYLQAKKKVEKLEKQMIVKEKLLKKWKKKLSYYEKCKLPLNNF